MPALVDMNPVLLKPSSDTRAQVIVAGMPFADLPAQEYQDLKPRLLSEVLAAFQRLREEFDAVIVEGAGSPAEINLRAGDYVNMGLARHAGLPTVVVGDIDRGGVFAAMYGTLALLEPEDQALISGFVVNKFRGDARILEPGLRELERRTGRRVLGVVPYVDGLHGDDEDSLALERAMPVAPAWPGRPPSISPQPAPTRAATCASGTPFAFERYGTVRDARGLTSRT